MSHTDTDSETAGVSEEVVTTVRSVLRDATEPVYVIDPSEQITRGMIGALASIAEPPAVRIVGRGKMLRRVRRDFLTASEAASFVADGSLAVRADPPDREGRMVVSGEAVHALVTARGTTVELTAEETVFVEDARERCERAWENAESFSLHTPGIDRLTGRMAQEFGPSFSDQFAESLGVARGLRDRAAFDPVTATLLIAAYNGEMHYDVSKLGEDTGLASKATFSRIKNQLEDDGIIDTEKVKKEVGRPRQRLGLTSQYHELADDRGITELIAHITT